MTIGRDPKHGVRHSALHIMAYRDTADFERVLAALEQAGTGHKIVEDARRDFADLRFGRSARLRSERSLDRP